MLKETDDKITFSFQYTTRTDLAFIILLVFIKQLTEAKFPNFKSF